MVIYISVLLAYGIFEIVSNSYHLTKGSKTKIAESAKKQHGEIPRDLNPGAYYYKAVLMFISGILFTLSSLIYFFFDKQLGLEFTLINAIINSIYGLVQVVMYNKFNRVYGAFVVYSLPLIFYFIVC